VACPDHSLTVHDLFKLDADLGDAKATADMLLAKTQEARKEEIKFQTTPVKEFSLNDDGTVAVELTIHSKV
jgi:hypothetical protein